MSTPHHWLPNPADIADGQFIRWNATLGRFEAIDLPTSIGTLLQFTAFNQAINTFGAQVNFIAAPFVDLTDETNCVFLMPFSGTVDRLTLWAGSGNVAADRTFTVRKNGVNQSLTTTIASGQQTGQDNVNSFPVNQLDRVSVILESAVPATEWIFISMRIK